MDATNWREVSWSRLSQTWDVLIVGGGITGAGLLHEATRMGLKSLLVEQRDFAWGASSRSSKLIHGGLRYLKEGKWHLTWEAVRERERFLKQGGGLIAPVGFLFPIYKGKSPGAMMHRLVFTIADLFALHRNHQHYRAEAFHLLAPRIPRAGLSGGFRYGEAQVDDARLVLRVLGEAMSAGGTALNYVRSCGKWPACTRIYSAPTWPVVQVPR